MRPHAYTLSPENRRHPALLLRVAELSRHKSRGSHPVSQRPAFTIVLCLCVLSDTTYYSQALSSDNVLLALSALMCERPVLVTCSVRSLLSVAVSSLKALLHPLDWHHAYAPLLPAAEVTFLFCRFYVRPQNRQNSKRATTMKLNVRHTCVDSMECVCPRNQPC